MLTAFLAALPTTFRTLAAAFGAALAMIVVMLFALRGAKVAGFGAEFAEFPDERRIAGHERDAQTAQIGAIPAGADTGRHSAGIDTGIGAVLALSQALDTCFDTILDTFLRHDFLPQRVGMETR